MTRPPIRILLVDDNDDFRSATLAWIATEPSLAIAGDAASGEEAIDATQRLLPDVVLVDVVMPGLDGFETTRRLKALSTSPSVVMTSFLDTELTRLEAERAGADAYVSKGDLTDRLRSVIGDVVNSNHDLI